MNCFCLDSFGLEWEEVRVDDNENLIVIKEFVMDINSSVEWRNKIETSFCVDPQNFSYDLFITF